MLRVKWQLTEVLSFVSHYFEILIHALITSLLVSYNLFKGRLSQTSAGPKCLLTGTKTKMIFFQNEKRLLYVFKRFMVLPVYLTDLWHCFAPSQALRLAGQSLLVLPISRRKLRGHSAFSVVVPRLWNPLHFQSAASQKLFSFLWLLFFGVAGEAAVYCFPLFCVFHCIFLILPMVLLAYRTLALSVVVKCCTNKVELSLNVKPTLPGKQLS